MPDRIARSRPAPGTFTWSASLRRGFADWRDRRAARQRVRALLRRADDHLLNDMGATREDLRACFALWDEG